MKSPAFTSHQSFYSWRVQVQASGGGRANSEINIGPFDVWRLEYDQSINNIGYMVNLWQLLPFIIIIVHPELNHSPITSSCRPSVFTGA